MLFRSLIIAATAAVVPTLADADSYGSSLPSLDVPACPSKGTIQYNKSVPNKTDFPLTQVDLCYDTQALRATFTAYNETNYYYNSSYKTNDPIYNYEVMEGFFYRGTNDPQTYLEFEVAPNNVTFNSFVYNPSKVRAAGAPFDHFLFVDPQLDGFNSTTVLNKPKQTWVSNVRIPLGLFNVDDGQAKGTQWRMNFFRTVTSKAEFPTQQYGAWSVPPGNPNFHQTPYFGNVKFV